jgi:N,N'-diacetylchitobiose transport system permease protein
VSQFAPPSTGEGASPRPDPRKAGTSTTAGPQRAARRRVPAPGARRRQFVRGVTPYVLVIPTLVVIAAVLGYPTYDLVKVSFQHFGLRELIHHTGTWVGTANYRAVLGDSGFWHIVLRTSILALSCVALTLVIGTAIALLLGKVSKLVRLFITASLVAAWAMPAIVQASIWKWLVDYDFGILNYTLTRLGIVDYSHHDWFTRPIQGFGVITACIVWGAVPFVTITVYAGLAQLPGELLEAARVDDGSAWHGFRHITLPILWPIFVILTTLSLIWDFGVFLQVWILLGNSVGTPDYYLMSTYAFFAFQNNNYGVGAAIAIVTVVILFCVTGFYVRQMVRTGEVAR